MVLDYCVTCIIIVQTSIMSENINGITILMILDYCLTCIIIVQTNNMVKLMVSYIFVYEVLEERRLCLEISEF